MKTHSGLLLSLLLFAGPLIAVEHGVEDEQDSMSNEAVEQERSTSADVAAEQSGFSSGSVMRSAFTTRIDEREPVDDLDKLDNDTQEVYYFTELRDMEGQTAKHRWEYEGEVMAEVEFNVNGPRWRVWSSKRFVPDWTGEWTVSVVNAADEVIAEDTLEYVEETGAPAGTVDNADDRNMENSRTLE